MKKIVKQVTFTSLTIEKSLKLKPSLLKRLGLLAICSLFVTIGIFLVEDNSFLAWSTIIFFGLGVLVFSIHLLPNSSYLILSHEGFEVRNLYRSYFTKWSEVKRFTVGTSGKTKMVQFNYSSGHKKQSKGKLISRLLSGSEGGLPDTYGMKADQLARLMNEWKSEISN